MNETDIEYVMYILVALRGVQNGTGVGDKIKGLRELDSVDR